MKKKNKMVFLTVLLIVIFLTSLACNFGIKNGNIATTLTFNEDRLVSLINGAQGIAEKVSEEDLNVKVQNIDFIEPDKILLEGEFEEQDMRMNGSIELTFTLENEEPKVVISNVEIPGVPITPSNLEQMNEKLSYALQILIDQAEENAKIKRIYVEKESLKFDLEIPFRK